MKKMLSPKGMKTVKMFHILFASWWIGALVAMWFLSFWPAKTGDELYTLLSAILLVDDFVLVPGATVVFITAIIYGVKTNFGFFKQRWLTAKWVIALAVAIIGTFYYHPMTVEAIDIVDKGRDAAMNDPHVLFTIQQTKLYSLQFAALLAIVIISVFKPWKKKQTGKSSLNVAE